MMKYYITKSNFPWDNAAALCTHNDMNFITFEAKNEAKYYSQLNGEIWIGTSDSEVEGNYRNYYEKGSAVGSILNWGSGEPNNGGTGEDCIDVRANGYNDAGCGTNLIAGCMSKLTRFLVR
jgi:hypothetical protein